MKLSQTSTENSGFTLIELLVVIAIIGILSSVVLASLSGARESARKASTQGQLDSLNTAVQMLINDTGAGPAGCNNGTEGNHFVFLYEADAGLVSKPPTGEPGGSQGDPCTWSSEEVSSWNGPYVSSDNLTDGWGERYRFDSSWVDNNSCPRDSGIAAIYSKGPDNSASTCDDIFVKIGP